MCMQHKKSDYSIATSALVGENEHARRDYFVASANRAFLCCSGFGTACMLLSTALVHPLQTMVTVLVATLSISVGVVLRYWAHKAAEVFDNINHGQPETSWKDGTYRNVDRYPLAPIGIYWDHALQVIKVQANYSIQFVKFIGYRVLHAFFAKEPTEQEIVQYAFNSTVLTLMNVERGAESLCVKLQIDMRSPFLEAGRMAHLNVAFHVPNDDYSLERSKVMAFSFDGIEITKRPEQLLVLSTVCSAYIHPLLHSFNNGLYQKYGQLSPQEREKWNDLFLHGQYLNEVAHTFPADSLGISRSVFQEIIKGNTKADLHNHGKTTTMLAPYSRFARFILGTRVAIHRLVKKHRVPVNPEELFLTSVMHSMDHLMTGNALLYRNLDTEQLRPQSDPHMMNYMWYLPSENIFTNLLKDKVETNDFYSEFYTAAKGIDEEFADHVTLSICF